MHSLPGSVVERQLQDSYVRMLPELLRYSSASSILDKVPEELQAVHRANEAAVPSAQAAPSASSKAKAKARVADAVDFDLWDGWNDAEPNPLPLHTSTSADDEDDVDLSEMGL